MLNTLQQFTTLKIAIYLPIVWSRVIKYLKENDKFGGNLFNVTHVLNIFKFYFIMEISIKTPIKIKRILTNKTCSKYHEQKHAKITFNSWIIYQKEQIY